MGSCVSVQKDTGSAVGLGRLSDRSKNENLATASAVKQDVDAASGGDHAAADLAAKSESSSLFLYAVSRDEAFFDSHPWLESDCEDDFLSVNGEFTPSRGSTPVHHTFLGNEADMQKSLMKKRLSELFEESIHLHESADGEKTPEKLMGGDGESAMATQCCLPSFSYMKRKMSPILANG